MKVLKKALVTVFAAMLLLHGIVFAAEDKKINVTIDDIPVVFNQQDPVIIGGFTMVPVKEISESLGASVSWNQQEKKVTLVKGNISASMVNNVNEITISELDAAGNVKSSRKVTLDTCVTILNGKTMVPARVVAETFGVKVEWHARSRTVRLTRPGYYVGAPIVLGE